MSFPFSHFEESPSLLVPYLRVKVKYFTVYRLPWLLPGRRRIWEWMWSEVVPGKIHVCGCGYAVVSPWSLGRASVWDEPSIMLPETLVTLIALRQTSKVSGGKRTWFLIQNGSPQGCPLR